MESAPAQSPHSAAPADSHPRLPSPTFLSSLVFFPPRNKAHAPPPLSREHPSLSTNSPVIPAQPHRSSHTPKAPRADDAHSPDHFPQLISPKSPAPPPLLS